MEKNSLSNDMIECSFVPFKRYFGMAGNIDEERYGIYSGNMYSIQDFGLKRWVVLAYLKTDFQKYREAGMTDIEIVNKCINFLNAPEERKKYQKKDTVPKYGNLKLINEKFKMTNKFGFECAIVELSIDQKRNENFWGEGAKF